jgi:hypothetical protein
VRESHSSVDPPQRLPDNSRSWSGTPKVWAPRRVPRIVQRGLNAPSNGEDNATEAEEPPRYPEALNDSMRVPSPIRLVPPGLGKWSRRKESPAFSREVDTD